MCAGACVQVFTGVCMYECMYVQVCVCECVRVHARTRDSALPVILCS